MSSIMFGQSPKDTVNAYSEYETILKQANHVIFAAIPFTKNKDDRAKLVNSLIK